LGKRCQQADVRPSMGSAGDCFDNALCERFFATLEYELLDRYPFRKVEHGPLMPCERTNYVDGKLTGRDNATAIQAQ
jgi:transposase InsO family protein